MNTNLGSKLISTWFISLAVGFWVFFAVVFAYAQTPILRANGKIAFTSDRDGNGNLEIYVMNNDGTEQVRLTNNSVVDCLPAFSPDGTKIAFVSQQTSLLAFLMVMNVDGTDQTEVTPITLRSSSFSPWPAWENSSLSWSPDGTKIAFDDAGEIFRINIDGSDRTNLTNNPFEDIAPAWSPDGSRILFTSHRVGYLTMHTMDAVDGSDVRVLSSRGYSWDVSPDWSPTGDKIVFTELSEDWWPYIYIATPDGNNRQIVDGGGQGTRNMPKWSPDGSRIVFHHRLYPSEDCEIYVKNLNSGELTQLTNTIGNNGQPSWQPLLPTRTLFDFDGDRRADISVFRPSERVWYLDRSNDGFSATQFGLPSDKITPADYDGDGKTDIAVYRDGTWYWLGSTDGEFHAVGFGLANDVPTAADYDGDGKADLSVFRPSDGTWYRQNSSNGQFSATQFGQNGDVPVTGDHDGDGKTDLTVYRPSNSYWYIYRSSDDQVQANAFGSNDDIPLNGDFNGDGRSDLAVFRPSNGTWYIARPTGIPGQNFNAIQFGISTDIPAPADYDGDGKTDIAVFRDGIWYLQQSTGGFAVQQFGLASDKPIPAAYWP